MPVTIAVGVTLAVALAACREADPPEGRDHTRVHEQRTHAAIHVDVPFDAEVVTLFRTRDVLPDLSIRDLAVVGERVYAAAPSGLFRLNATGDAFEDVPLDGRGPIVRIGAGEGGRLLLARGDRVDVLESSGAVAPSFVVSTSSGTVTAAAELRNTIYAGTTAGLYALDVSGGRPIALVGGIDVRDLEAVIGVLWIASDVGVLRYEPVSGSMLPAFTSQNGLADDDVRALAISEDMRAMLIATRTGLTRIPLDGSPQSTMKPGRGGLPTGDLRALAERSGVLLVGHGVGASAVAPGRIEHYHSLRWIPDEEVTAVALGADMSRWIATPAGISRIAFKPSTLTEKAEALERNLDWHWRMDGFVDDGVVFDDPWELSGEPRHDDNDNDGLWTEMQIGTWCFAYATTGDEQYYERARRAMDVMFLEFDVPAATFVAQGRRPGFITRSLVRDDEGELFSEKAARSNWHFQEFDGRSYYWKDDTSSDEYAGHYFGIPLFYDLCAKSELEREEIRKRIRWSTDYLIDNGYVLIDLDGEKTTFGRWEDLSAAADGLDACTALKGFDVATCVGSYYGAGWLNSIEILGHLLAAWHITGDQKYYDEYERLHTIERYGEMIPVRENTWTVTNPRFANHSDHELAMLAYHTLLRYEPNPERREVWSRSILDMYEHEREEHNPWQVATIGSAVFEDVDLEGAIRALQEIPLDRRQMRYDNSHRLDAGRGPPDRHDSPQFDRVFPYDEIRTMKWNGNPYAVAGGGDPRAVLSPTPYLIAYWMLRYYGLLETR